LNADSLKLMGLIVNAFLICPAQNLDRRSDQANNRLSESSVQSGSFPSNDQGFQD